MKDIDDDLMIGVKSTAITWKGDSKTIMNRMIGVSALCFVFMAAVNVTSAIGLPSALLTHFNFYNALKNLDLTNKEKCSEFFKESSYFGALILLSIVFGKSLDWLLT